ncbi:tyrosine-type recombinase/integrase [Maridesulfovibrio sp.]|uniref:tyrosine-type recombinase/integrase n=1 Tax=Maridesulfovibrio sp. TaxID=2795000 RepID=UPI003B00618C
MRGSPKYQVTQIFRKSGIFQPGSSKHMAKDQARGEGAKTWAQIAEKTAIYSYKTADAYREIWLRFAKFARKNEGLRDLVKVEPRHVRSYLEHCAEKGVSAATFGQYAAALGKFENALNLFVRGKRSYNLRSGIKAARRPAVNLVRFDDSRAYERPVELVSSVRSESHQLAAQIQLHTGCRVREAALIESSQVSNGQFSYQGKGGLVVTKNIPQVLESKLRVYFNREGQFKIDPEKYRRSLKTASVATGQKYQGSHGLRWSYAQGRMVELRMNNVSYYDSLRIVSYELGHKRPDITEHYLR